MARPTPGRAQFHYLESWLLPSLGLRATVFHFNPGYELDQDYYLDVGRYTPSRRWRSRTTTSTLWCAPVSASTWTTSTSSDRRPARSAHPRSRRAGGANAAAAIDGLSRHDYDLDRWLRSAGMTSPMAARWNRRGSCGYVRIVTLADTARRGRRATARSRLWAADDNAIAMHRTS